MSGTIHFVTPTNRWLGSIPMSTLDPLTLEPLGSYLRSSSSSSLSSSSTPTSTKNNNVESDHRTTHICGHPVSLLLTRLQTTPQGCSCGCTIPLPPKHSDYYHAQHLLRIMFDTQRVPGRIVRMQRIVQEQQQALQHEKRKRQKEAAKKKKRQLERKRRRQEKKEIRAQAAAAAQAAAIVQAELNDQQEDASDLEAGRRRNVGMGGSVGASSQQQQQQQQRYAQLPPPILIPTAQGSSADGNATGTGTRTGAGYLSVPTSSSSTSSSSSSSSTTSSSLSSASWAPSSSSSQSSSTTTADSPFSFANYTPNSAQSQSTQINNNNNNNNNNHNNNADKQSAGSSSNNNNYNKGQQQRQQNQQQHQPRSKNNNNNNNKSTLHISIDTPTSHQQQQPQQRTRAKRRKWPRYVYYLYQNRSLRNPLTNTDVEGDPTFYAVLEEGRGGWWHEPWVVINPQEQQEHQKKLQAKVPPPPKNHLSHQSLPTMMMMTNSVTEPGVETVQPSLTPDPTTTTVTTLTPEERKDRWRQGRLSNLELESFQELEWRRWHRMQQEPRRLRIGKDITVLRRSEHGFRKSFQRLDQIRKREVLEAARQESLKNKSLRQGQQQQVPRIRVVGEDDEEIEGNQDLEEGGGGVGVEGLQSEKRAGKQKRSTVRRGSNGKEIPSKYSSNSNSNSNNNNSSSRTDKRIQLRRLQKQDMMPWWDPNPLPDKMPNPALSPFSVSTLPEPIVELFGGKSIYIPSTALSSSSSSTTPSDLQQQQQSPNERPKSPYPTGTSPTTKSNQQEQPFLDQDGCRWINVPKGDRIAVMVGTSLDFLLFPSFQRLLLHNLAREDFVDHAGRVGSLPPYPTLTPPDDYFTATATQRPSSASATTATPTTPIVTVTAAPPSPRSAMIDPLSPGGGSGAGIMMPSGALVGGGPGGLMVPMTPILPTSTSPITRAAHRSRSLRNERLRSRLEQRSRRMTMNGRGPRAWTGKVKDFFKTIFGCCWPFLSRTRASRSRALMMARARYDQERAIAAANVGPLDGGARRMSMAMTRANEEQNEEVEEEEEEEEAGEQCPGVDKVDGDDADGENEDDEDEDGDDESESDKEANTTGGGQDVKVDIPPSPILYEKQPQEDDDNATVQESHHHVSTGKDKTRRRHDNMSRSGNVVTENDQHQLPHRPQRDDKDDPYGLYRYSSDEGSDHDNGFYSDHLDQLSDLSSDGESEYEKNIEEDFEEEDTDTDSEVDEDEDGFDPSNPRSIYARRGTLDWAGNGFGTYDPALFSNTYVNGEGSASDRYWYYVEYCRFYLTILIAIGIMGSIVYGAVQVEAANSIVAHSRTTGSRTPTTGVMPLFDEPSSTVGPFAVHHHRPQKRTAPPVPMEATKSGTAAATGRVVLVGMGLELPLKPTLTNNNAKLQQPWSKRKSLKKKSLSRRRCFAKRQEQQSIRCRRRQRKPQLHVVQPDQQETATIMFFQA